MSTTPKAPSPEQRVEFLTRLRSARALVLRDAESFHEAATVLEYIGQIMRGRIENGLGAYKEEIIALATSVNGVDERSVRRQFQVVREARNDAVHDGAYVRHLSSRLADLLVLLEEAVMAELPLVGDVMVRSPVFANPWHLVSHVRREMLANSFTNIPICVEEAGRKKWKFITDSGVMQFLRSSPDPATRKNRVSMAVGDAILSRELTTTPATCCGRDELVSKLAATMSSLPVLVVETHGAEEQLIGIISAFDLL